MLFLQKPTDFRGNMEITSCLMERDGKFLFLLRHDNKPQGNTWGVPAGKIDPCEDREAAVLREIEEKTGLIIPKDRLRFFQTVFVRYTDKDFVYHMFHCADAGQVVQLNPAEHKDFGWFSLDEALEMDLIEDEDASIRLFQEKMK